MEALRAYRVIFPDSEQQLIKLAQNLVTKYDFIVVIFSNMFRALESSFKAIIIPWSCSYSLGTLRPLNYKSGDRFVQ